MEIETFWHYFVKMGWRTGNIEGKIHNCTGWKNNKTSKSVQKEEENEKRKGYRIGYGIYYGSVCFGIAGNNA